MLKISKKELALRYNEINKEFYQHGVQSQKIELSESQITIFASVSRTPMLDTLADRPDLVLFIDASLNHKYKQRIKDILASEFDLAVKAIYKDFDQDTNTSCTVILLHT
ncbi:Na-translocating system protein MpsC family protein [Sinobaca sp. H24]|uniref:Na-translocating system protein MpsC family protein n=1 Tax=Sinobaca sp. H24 TaxID=2923376 RepID=UPI00207A6366|nr:Na-translocating system protein MpsC family protein [Sinobaca sp. H24]